MCACEYLLHKQIEEQLKVMLLQWEKDYGREFLVNDQRYIDTISEQWNAYSETKEQEKLKKVRQKRTRQREGRGGRRGECHAWCLCVCLVAK